MRRLSLIALVLGVALCLVGLAVTAPTDSTAASPSAPSGEGARILRVGWNYSPESLNPFIGTATEAYAVYHLNYDRLVEYDAGTLDAAPGLAKSWSHSPDGKTWTFELRDDVKWQDGTPFTARDVVFTFEYVIDNEMGAYYSYTRGITDVVAEGDHTVVFTTEKPKATMLQMWVPILPEHIWSKISPEDAERRFTNDPPVIGTGPFQVVEWKHDEWLRMRANPDYWGDKPKIDEILFVIYKNPDTMASELEAGMLQYAPVTQAAFKRLENAPGLTAAYSVEDAFDDIGFNCYDLGPSRGHPAVRDPAFRHALAWAVDREKIAELAYGGAAEAASSILASRYWPESNDYHWEPSADQAFSYDPEKAGQLLDEAGYRDTDGDGIREYKGEPIKLRLWASTERPELPLAGKLVAGYLKDVGLKIVYQAMDPGSMVDSVYATKNDELNPDFDMFVWGWAGDYDPGFILSVLTTDQINNWGDVGWSNTEYDRLYEAQDSELDPAARRVLVHQMQQIVAEECPYIPLVYRHGREAYDTSRWTGWVKMPTGAGSVDSHWTFLSVEPVTGTASSESGATGITVAAIAAAAAVIAALVVWRVRVRRRTEEHA